MEKDFVTWVMEELEERGWSYSELARRAGVSASTISMVISGKRSPGWELCAGIAQAFNLSPLRVFALAGLMVPLPGLDKDATVEQVVQIMRALSPEQREEILALARWRYDQKES